MVLHGEIGPVRWDSLDDTAEGTAQGAAVGDGMRSRYMRKHNTIIAYTSMIMCGLFEQAVEIHSNCCVWGVPQGAPIRAGFSALVCTVYGTLL
jgi:hypothetical protein